MLDLAQDSYLGNLTNHGESFFSIKKLSIDHSGTKDILILKAPDFLPRDRPLEKFTIYCKNVNQNKQYNISEIIENWVPGGA